MVVRIGLAAACLWVLATAPAGATCISFEENKVGDAYLVNNCQTEMNVSYCVNGENSTKGCNRGFSHLPVAARSRRLLWPGTRPPAAGTYQINVPLFSRPFPLRNKDLVI